MSALDLAPCGHLESLLQPFVGLLFWHKQLSLTKTRLSIRTRGPVMKPDTISNPPTAVKTKSASVS